MARARQLKPSFFMDEDVACLTFAERILFAGLWTLADREGRLEDRPAWIRVQLFPYDDLEGLKLSMNDMLDSLARPRKNSQGAFIVRYVVEGKAYIQVCKFTKHQHPHPKEPASELPPVQALTQKPCKAAASNVKQRPSRVTPLSGRAVPSVPSVPSVSSVPSESAPPALVVGRKPWTSDAIDDHRELRGEPKGGGGRIGAALKAIVDRYTWERVRPVWRSYLGSDAGKFGAEHFAANFLALELPPARASPFPTVGERALKSAAEFLRSKGETGDQSG